MFRRIFKPWLFAGSVLLWIIGCSNSRWTKEIVWPDFRWDALPSQEDYPEAGAVILLDEAEVEIFRNTDSPFSVMNRHRIVKILNEKGFRHANFIIPFDNNTEINSLEARTIRPDRRIFTLDKSKVFETSLYPDYVFYSDVKGLRFAMPAVEPGTVVEFKWQVQVRNFTFWTHWPFQQSDPVKISRYTIHCPSSWKVPWKCYKCDIQPEILSYGGTYQTYRWQVCDVEPLRPEIGMPPGMGEIPGLLFSPVGMNTWDDVAEWYFQLAQDRMTSDEFIGQIVDSLIQNTNSELEKLQRIFEYVRDRVRYLAIEIGIGGYQPHPASEVIQNLYGDCKDMATLIVAMSEAAGINADPVLISTYQNGEMDTCIVTPAQFNHAIAAAVLSDHSEVWMDATDKQCAFGELPWYDQNRLVLVVNDSARALIKMTPYDLNHINHSLRQWELELFPDGSTEGKVSMTFSGTLAQNLRMLLRRESENDQKTWCCQELLGRFPGAEVDSFNIQGLDQLGESMIFNIQFHFFNPHDSSQTYRIYQPGTWSGYEWHRMFASKERRADVSLQFPLTIQDEVTIHFPKTWAFLTESGSGSLSESFGGYYYRIKLDTEDGVYYKRYFRISEMRVDVSQYSDFRSFLNDVAALDRKTIVFQVK